MRYQTCLRRTSGRRSSRSAPSARRVSRSAHTPPHTSWPCLPTDAPSLFRRRVRPFCRDAGLPETKDNIKSLFISRVRENLHIVLCMSPVGSAFRVRCRMFPSLINCCTIDWFDRWPEEALQSVSQQFFEALDLPDRETVLPGLCDMSSIVHSTVVREADRFFEELKRRFYVTPKSFLELISLYLAMLDEKRESMDVSIQRLSVGVRKLNETNAVVEGMRAELDELQPVLEQKSKETEAMLIQVNKDRADADEKKKVVAKEEAAVKKTADEVQAIADDARADLEAAMPALKEAVEALNGLSKNDISEIKAFAKPPPLVQKVMECVCLLLGAKTDWDSAKKVPHHLDPCSHPSCPPASPSKPCPTHSAITSRRVKSQPRHVAGAQRHPVHESLAKLRQGQHSPEGDQARENIL
ncbi:MAG: hypothetical protein CBD47_05050 [Synechococcus sp. TMED187]|nr:MAG: hypothetical protein CBD47_05050 [Synechococcus sp. TMED187]